MPDLLLEVLSEEIPARMQAGGAQKLEKQVCSRLEDARLSFDTEGVQSFATPRRLALIVPGLPAEQPDITVERKGPRVDAPEKAIQGFLKSTGLTLDDCEQRETAKGPVWFAVKQEKGRPTADLLAELLPEALAAVSWPKSMRWDESGVRWVRPIRSILCLLDDAVVPFRFGTVHSGRTTLGHRFMSSGAVKIEHTGDYEDALRGARVMLDPKERAQKIKDEANALAKNEKFLLLDDERLVERLVDENAGLVEWPVVLPGSIDPQFLDLPGPVQRSAMGTHQRYFGLLDLATFPAPRFIMVADTETAAGSAAVVAGNERVLRARLADARFFWDQDTRQSLEERVDDLDGVIFHARLGSMYQKAKRIEKLARTLFGAIGEANPGWAADTDPEDAARAGLLCKADLVTETVGEFPDLQGIIGRWCATHDGEPPAVRNAIADHYAPLGPDDRCPELPVSVAVALADKLDTLTGFFAIDERPTGSKDPFALRRAALGVVRIIMEQEPPLRLPLGPAVDAALAGYADLLPEAPGPEATKDALLAFFADRFKVLLRGLGLHHGLVNAVFGATGEDDPNLLLERIRTLDNFLNTEDGANLLTAYRRAANILRIEERNDGVHYEGEPDVSLLGENEEHVLYNRLAVARAKADTAVNQELFADAMAAMATLREPVDAFFDNVTVNCEDAALRRNRLLMLSQIRSTLDRVADFSKIEG